MHQVAIPINESPLLESAITKLRPDVFSHPIWVRFGNCKNTFSSKTINDLFIEADKLLQNKPNEACQILLICAVFQHYGGQSAKALTTIQKVQNLAEQTRLNQEFIWSLWGGAAICFQQGNLEAAASHLANLRGFLSTQDEWVLADFVDVVQQAMIQPGTTKQVQQTHSQEDHMDGCLTTPFQWLNTWGLSLQSHDPDHNVTKRTSVPDTKGATLLSLQGWRSLRLRFAGELKVHWLESRSRSGMKRFPFWGFILKLLHIHVTANEADPQLIEIQHPDPPSIIVVPELPAQAEPVVENMDKALKDAPPLISMSIHMLGRFRISIQESVLDLPPSRRLSLLKYLVLHHKQSTPRETLMDTFWPDVSPDKARNNLNVAISGIRQTFRAVGDAPIVVHKNDAYGLAPELQLWVDVEEFEQLVDSGRRLESQGKLKASIDDYEAAISLYLGDFLEENPYESWTVLPRERLRLAYLVTLDHLSQIYYHQEKYATCIALSQLILSRDRCREDAHSMLMQCYNHQGQDHMALRQYQACVEALRMELDVTPAPETTKLYEQIRQHKRV